jgi:hypothetical protein
MVAIDLSPDPKGVPVGVTGSVNISVYRTVAKRGIAFFKTPKLMRLPVSDES